MIFHFTADTTFSADNVVDALQTLADHFNTLAKQTDDQDSMEMRTGYMELTPYEPEPPQSSQTG